jgi:hypothetical protein
VRQVPKFFFAKCRRQKKNYPFFTSQANYTALKKKAAKIKLTFKLMHFVAKCIFANDLTYKELGNFFLPATFCDKNLELVTR